MGIVSSTFLSLAVQLAWNCQRFLDPRYRYIEAKPSSEVISISSSHNQFLSKKNTEKKCIKDEIAKQIFRDGVIHNNCPIIHQDNRNKRMIRLRHKRIRRSSFDATLITKEMNKNEISVPFVTDHRVISSTPNTLTRKQTPIWNSSSMSFSSSSSSLSSSSSSSSSSSPSSLSSMSSNEETGVDVEVKKINVKNEKDLTQPEQNIDNVQMPIEGRTTMTAAEETAFRLTVGRGHFSRSKKDRFLNNLRLEKRLNDLNREFFELGYRTHSRSLHQYHSSDLKKSSDHL